MIDRALRFLDYRTSAVGHSAFGGFGGVMRYSLPAAYESLLGVKETERAIKEIKDFFQLSLATELNLTRVTAPLFVLSGLGINDDLNGIERPVSFPVKAMDGARAEIVHSLAKWKRLALAEYGFKRGFGLYTDMNAIRADEDLDPIHSLYVDQWDWERVIGAADRNLDFLKLVVRKIYSSFKRLEFRMHDLYPALPLELPEEITFVHAEDAQARYPALSPRNGENALRRKTALFLIGIGWIWPTGKPHDGRARLRDGSTPTGAAVRGSTRYLVGTAFSAGFGSRPWESGLTRRRWNYSWLKRGRKRERSFIFIKGSFRVICRSA